MTVDPKVLKRAVELADGWRLSDDAEPLIYLTDGMEPAEIDTEIAETSSDTITLTSTSTANDISFMSWSYPQWMLDALAAQLLRQSRVTLRELEDNRYFVSDGDSADTINAIVEFYEGQDDD